MSGDRFVREQRLGAGAFGEVWKAWDPKLQRFVALKLLKRLGPDDLERFRREATLAARLSDPGIAAVYEIGETDEKQPYIAMQFVEGRTLAGLKVDTREAVRIVRDAANVVDAAHRAHIIHRDLKPSNIMIDASGRVFVVDFGLAWRLDAAGLTATGIMVGTPAYMAPEQARGEPVTAATDVWALGATLHELMAGRPPFGGDTLLDVLMAIQEQELAPLSGADANLAAVVSSSSVDRLGEIAKPMLSR